MKQKIVTIILAVTIILVVGLLVTRQKPNSQNSPPPPPPNQKPMSELELLLKSFPPETSSSQERADFAARISVMSKDAGLLNITNCLANPLVFTVHLGKTFAVMNNDLLPHVLSHTKFKVNLPAKATIQTNLDITAEGVYGYSCDGNNSGVFYVTK